MSNGATDRRLTPFNGRVAHVSLRNQVQAEQFAEGELLHISAITTDLMSDKGNRERQLLKGESFLGLDSRDGKLFGIAQKDGYVGWVDGAAFAPAPSGPATHKVCAARSYAKTTCGLKTMGQVTPLPFGARLIVVEEKDGWSRIEWSRGTISSDRYVPSGHLMPVDKFETNPAMVAERLLGTPYLWGGNSSFGLDCSGLVQAALLACGLDCPGDSDLQETAFGDAAGGYQRGDLLFWKGHVAMMTDPATLIHANAHHMAVTHENADAAIARIKDQGDGPVTGHKRPA